jgi:hypothetical protein
MDGNSQDFNFCRDDELFDFLNQNEDQLFLPQSIDTV